MITSKICFIGAGNMARAIINGLLTSGMAAENICTAAPSEEHLQQLSDCFAISTSLDNHIAAQADVVIYCMKPQQFDQVFSDDFIQCLNANTLHLSILAGTKLARFEQALGKAAIVRAMPNTPAMVGQSTTALFGNDYLSSEQTDIAQQIFNAIGPVYAWQQAEDDIDKLTAISGSGPAYFFYILELLSKHHSQGDISTSLDKCCELLTNGSTSIDNYGDINEELSIISQILLATCIALAKAGQKIALDEYTSLSFAKQTAVGALLYAIDQQYAFRRLREQVTSKGGTTEAALNSLYGNDLNALFMQELEASESWHETLQTYIEQAVSKAYERATASEFSLGIPPIQ